jgi:hypothetical protein
MLDRYLVKLGPVAETIQYRLTAKGWERREIPGAWRRAMRELTPRQQAAKDRATKTLTHYVRLLLERTAGEKAAGPDADTDAEIADDLVEAATPDDETPHARAVRGEMGR